MLQCFGSHDSQKFVDPEREVYNRVLDTQKMKHIVQFTNKDLYGNTHILGKMMQVCKHDNDKNALKAKIWPSKSCLRFIRTEETINFPTYGERRDKAVI